MNRYPCLLTTSVLFLGFAAPLSALDPNLPHPYPRPQPVSSVFGNPALAPSGDGTAQWDEALVQATVNAGDPFSDHGHWRLSNVLYRAPWVIGQTGTAPTQWTSAEAAQWAQQWDATQDWEDGSLLRYTLLRPPADAPRPPDGWPLVVLNPGSGGVGGSGGPVTEWGSPYYRQHYPAYVLNLHPQERTMDYLTDAVLTMPSFHAAFDLIDSLLEDAAFDIDPRRLYVGGFSMGGSTTWLMMLKRPHFFAAAFPVSSRPIHTFAEAERLRHHALWMTTGHDDGASGSSYYLRAYQQLMAAGAERVRFWEVQFTGHSGTVLRSFFLPEWLFAQTLPQSSPPVAEMSVTRAGDLTLLFDASSEPGDSITRIDWDFGDGNTAEGTLAQHTYLAPGTYTVRLRVWNAANRTATEYRTVVVSPASLVVNAPPKAHGFNVETPYNTAFAFSNADFEAVTSDPENDVLAAIRVDRLPIKGQLRLGDTPVVAGQVIPAAELDNLTYLPAGNTGWDRFEFRVADAYGWSPFWNDLSFAFQPNRGEMDSGVFDHLQWSPYRNPMVSILIGPPPPSALFTGLWTASSGMIETANITVGAQFFSDDTGPVIVALPDEFEGAEMIRTTSSRTTTGGIQDSNRSSAGTWIRFTVDADARVFVAYDNRGAATPAWLDDWEIHSVGEIRAWFAAGYRVYKKDFTAGSTVELGTNKAPPAQSNNINSYFIIGQALGEGPPGGDPPTPVPARSELLRLPDGSFRLEWQGAPGFLYRVRESEDLSIPPEDWPIVHEAMSADEPSTYGPLTIPEGTRRFWIIETRQP